MTMEFWDITPAYPRGKEPEDDFARREVILSGSVDLDFREPSRGAHLIGPHVMFPLNCKPLSTETGHSFTH